ncbi:aldehyde dehydrogenase family protein [Cupriavidus consociatus]|uniref:aldehyde dehydrogenase family protein n=1 Tax=Cupriavidus consociatus TaxID=2821357 RepID=UPI001AEB835E|nr:MULTISPECIES: aldehyde dehydrogenase family protein [unclassified Cupriavidus]MBP0621022.1 aldehyde dehydrogenase family protein [Cupriavidus sp. LEh25]MDK2657691.1 aldehyde dehydrogenase family protein [Cupriavidus sp. LEh21]
MENSSSEFNSLVRSLIGTEAIGSYIAGEMVAGDGAKLSLVDPASEQILLQFADTNAEVVGAAVQSCHAGQKQWAAFSAQRRGEIMAQLGKLIQRDAEPLARLEAITSGKAIKAARAQVAAVAEIFRYYSGWTDKFLGNVIPVPGGQLNYTLRQPLGIVLAITPWNSPIYLAAWNVAPALAMGNSVLLKPSELTPLTALTMAKLAREAGMPAGTLNVVNGLGKTIGDAAISNPLVKKVVFVGSTQTGRAVNAAAARRPISCLLELGGKSANIVFDDADLVQAARAAVTAACANTGQNCAAGSRLLVQRGVYDEFVEAVGEAIAGYRIGHPLDESAEGGPINNRAQFDRINRMVEIGLSEGAELVAGGVSEATGHGYYVKPTVLKHVSNDMRIAREEVFGPVVVAIPFDTEAEAVAIANDSEFALAGAVWTRDVARAHRVVAKVNAGLLWVNMYRDMHVATPFGGNDSSGYGRSSGVECLYEYTRTKSVWVPIAEGC